MPAIENLGRFDHKTTLAVLKIEVEQRKQSRLARSFKAIRTSGFRPGRIPMKVVERQYGQRVEFEVRYDKTTHQFFDTTGRGSDQYAPCLGSHHADRNAAGYMLLALRHLLPGTRETVYDGQKKSAYHPAGGN